MNKKELIKKISEVVSENSKKGVITTTKFVGTYEYKSGYDTYVAVSFDLDKELIVYSYYQNDRGELLDVLVYKLNDLQEKELTEIWSNINTKDETIENYVYYSKIYDKNLKILSQLGIYTPKKEKANRIDITKIPELENENDAYIVDRNEKVHIVKCIGISPSGKKRYFDINDQPFNENEVCEICEGNKKIKNQGIFFLFDGNGYSKYKYLFFPNKKKLLEYAEEEKEIKKYFVVSSCLESWSIIRSKRPTPSSDNRIFTEKEEAEKYFENVKSDLAERFNTMKSKLEEKRKKLDKIIADANVVALETKDIYTDASEVILNKQYMYEVDEDENKYLGPFTAIGVTKGVALFENGIASTSWQRLIDVDIFEKLKESKKYKKVFNALKDVNKYIEKLNYALERLAEAKPFLGDDFYVPTWFINEAEKCIEEDI